MNKLSILDGSRPLKEDLEEVTMVELSLNEVMQALFEGRVILLTTYNNNRQSDILVRMKETNNGIVTQISKPTPKMGGFVGGQKYWSLHDVTINMLSMYPTYIYDPSRYDVGYKFEPNSIVEIRSNAGEVDVAIITKVFVDESNNFYYTLSGEGDKVFKEEELTEVKK